MTDEVITITPAWQVITFRDTQHARVTLLKEYHPRIVDCPRSLANHYTLNDLQHMVTASLKLERHSFITRQMQLIKDKEELAKLLWPMLITEGRKTTMMAYKKRKTEPSELSHVCYVCDYDPGIDQVRDLAYIKFAAQARVLIDFFVEKIAPMGKGGVPHYKFFTWVNELEELKTKQKKWDIWLYYKPMLKAKGMIYIYDPAKKENI